LAKPSQTEPKILEWAERFGKLVRLRTLKTFSGHTAYAVTVTDSEAVGEKQGLLVAQPHAHEPATTAGMMNFMCRMLRGAGLDGEPAPFDRRRLLREIEVTFIPDGNPFGRSRAPEDFWDGRRYTNEEFLKIAFGRDASGQRFPRQGRWSLDDQQPATVGIVYEQISEKVFVEPNRDRESTFLRLVRRVLDGGRVDRFLSLHQTEFESSDHNCEIILPFMQGELPERIRDANERWGRAVIQAWRHAGANPIADPRPLGYGEDQLRYFRACWPDIYRSKPAVTVEVQNNNTRTPPETQRKLQETAIHTSLESLLS
jgi:hypothetical protein